VKTAMQESGHMLRICRCTRFQCGMNGATHLDEADGRPLWSLDCVSIAMVPAGHSLPVVC
jgi:hypothetical protein